MSRRLALDVLKFTWELKENKEKGAETVSIEYVIERLDNIWQEEAQRDFKKYVAEIKRRRKNNER